MYNNILTNYMYFSFPLYSVVPVLLRSNYSLPLPSRVGCATARIMRKLDRVYL